MKKRLVLVPLFCVVLVSLGAAQRRSSGDRAVASIPHRLLALKAVGSTRYTDKEILAASGLQIGQDAAEGDFQEAAHRLGESGVFSNVVYSFSYSDAGVKLDLQLTDVDKSKLVPVNFENFVWFTDAELLADLDQRVPLFKQLLPASGTLPDDVNQALQALLSEKRYAGRVDFQREAKQGSGDFVRIVYRVEEISICIRNVEFPGASTDQAVFLKNAARTLSGAQYVRSRLAAIARNDFLPLYLERGYLKAAFGPPEPRVVTEPETKPEEAAPSEIDIDVMLPVTPGKMYSVSGVRWTGNSVVTADDAARLFHLATGQPANPVLLARDEEGLSNFYHSRGYMTVQIKPLAEIDDAEASVRYNIQISEGERYNMGELEILGVDSSSKDRLREAWTLREGDPYNAAYTRKFLDDAARFLPRGLQYSTKLDEDLDAKSKTVDVTIRFKPQ
ncbi:MAG: POTRA domain-containing protein [Terriglobales bacterium]